MSGDVRISGIGVVSPLAIGAAKFWDALCAGRSAIGVIRRFEPGPTSPRLAAEVADFPAREFLPPSLVRRMDRLSQMIGVASVLAAGDAGLAGKGLEPDELAVVVGSELGNLSESGQFLDRVFTKGPALANPMLFPNLVMNAPASQVSMALGCHGPNMTVSAGEISGEAALDVALGLLRRGRARAVIVAAGEELSELVFQALRGFGRLSPRGRGHEGARPFDEAANGLVLGEGATAIVIEGVESIRCRGGRSHAAIDRLDRFQLEAVDPHGWPKASAASGVAVTRLSPAEVVFAGADSSPERDALEVALLSRLATPGKLLCALSGALGSHASMGLTSVAAAALALVSGRLPPVIGLERPRADLRHELPRKAVEGAWRSALVVGAARGGAATAVELSRSVDS